MGKSLCLFLVVIIMAGLATSTFAAIDPEDILGIWTLDEDDGDEVKDVSGNAHDGEIIGNTKWVDGKFGKALELEGGYIKVEHTEDLSLETFSLTAWVKSPETVAPHQILMIKQVWPNRNYAMWIGGNGNIVAGTTNGGDIQAHGNSVVGGDWHHVAGTYDQEFLRIYADGVKINQVALSSTPNVCDAPLGIGGLPPAGDKGLYGVIDEVGIFRVGLEEDDVKRIMEDGLKLLVTAVESGGKLCTTWGTLRNSY